MVLIFMGKFKHRTRVFKLISVNLVFFFAGFCELIPMHLLRPFDERELELIICGISNIDVNDWRTHTRLKQCTPETSQVVWFWLVSSSFQY